jgi:5'(3')-deoxyribonucleotidase
MFPQTNTLLQSIINIAGSFSILSSPLTGDEEHCAEMKRKWLQDNIKFDIDEVIITKDKHLWAQDNVLIDDYALNIYKWEQHGGYGIKFQSNENTLSDVIIPLQALFKKC